MQLLNDKIIVSFDKDEKRKMNVGGIELVRAETWLFEELNSGETKYQQQLDLKQTQPQIAVIEVENLRFPHLKVGDKVFTHYLSFKNGEPIEHDGKECKVISEKSVFFKIVDGKAEMMEDTYLGEILFEEALKTDSGIFLTPYDEKKIESKIKITHIPKNSPYINIGDIVYTVDDNQYELDFLGKKYVKLNTWYIVATENGLQWEKKN